MASDDAPGMHHGLRADGGVDWEKVRRAQASSAEKCQHDDCEEDAKPHMNWCSTECYQDALFNAEVA